jgi:UDP-N-acetylmuramate--alanine ligase
MSSAPPPVDFAHTERIHFVGIGGIGMSALARHCLAEKKSVSGSDGTLSPITDALAAEGVRICDEQHADNITPDIELVVYTEAIPTDHPERLAAKKMGIPTLNYFDCLGLAMNPYYLIAVAGTHGKTTTTAMLTDIFEAAEKDPTAVVGSLRAKTGSNYQHGRSKYAIVEACEYKADFLSLRPEVLVITNIEHDHVDYFPDLTAVQDTFRQLISQVHEDGVVVANPADPNVAPVLADCPRRVISYVEYVAQVGELRQPGIHNRLNAAAAMAAAATQDIKPPVAAEALEHFAGTWRRFEYKGELNGAPVYDDYAHHPTAVRATIAGARELYPDKRLLVVFKPHMFTRTKVFFNEFAKSFQGADELLYLPIYAARDEDSTGVSARELAVKTLEYVPESQLYEDEERLLARIHSQANADTVIFVMGAGDVTEVAEQLVVA